MVTSFAYAQKYMTARNFSKYQLRVPASRRRCWTALHAIIRDRSHISQGPLFGVQRSPTSWQLPGGQRRPCHPSETTEQVLHPEKYLNKPSGMSLNVTLQLPYKHPGAGWTYSDGQFCEFDFQEILQLNGVDDSSAWQG